MSASPSEPRRVGWFDHPVLSLLLGVSWLAISRSIEPVHILSAVLIGLVVPRLLAGFLRQGNPVHWPTAVALTLVVLKDIVLSNITVARLVLGRMDTPQPAWLEVPLACEHPRVNALFASIITTTPGTVSAVVDEQRHCIWVHALNCDDAQAMIDDMKTRYEAPLMRIFGIATAGATA